MSEPASKQREPESLVSKSKECTKLINGRRVMTVLIVCFFHFSIVYFQGDWNLTPFTMIKGIELVAVITDFRFYQIVSSLQWFTVSGDWLPTLAGLLGKMPSF